MITTVNQQHSRIADLEETIRCLEVQRDLEIRRRRRNVLIVGVSLSLLVHLGLMLYLNLVHRSRPVGTGVQPVSIEFAVVAEQELTQLEDLQLEDLVPEVPMDLDLPVQEPSLDLDAEVSAASLDIAPSGSVPTLSGSGAGSGGISDRFDLRFFPVQRRVNFGELDKTKSNGLSPDEEGLA